MDVEEQGAGIFSRIKHSLKEAICTHEQTKTTSIYSQENVPLVVQAKPPGWLISATSSYCGSPFLPSLELGSTLATSLQSDNEGNKERSEHTNIENPEASKKEVAWEGNEDGRRVVSKRANAGSRVAGCLGLMPVREAEAVMFRLGENQYIGLVIQNWNWDQA